MPYGELACSKCLESKPESEFFKESKNTGRNFRRSTCKTCDLARVKEYNSRPGKRERKNETKRNNNRLRMFNFSPDLFNERLSEQGDVCAICKTDTPGGKGTFHADHDHETLRPRGVLCHNCNVGLGNLKDSPEILQAAIDYLKKYSEVQ